MRCPFPIVCNTSERLLSDGRVTCIGPYHRIGIYINDHSESVERVPVLVHLHEHFDHVLNPMTDAALV